MNHAPDSSRGRGTSPWGLLSAKRTLLAVPSITLVIFFFLDFSSTSNGAQTSATEPSSLGDLNDRSRWPVVAMGILSKPSNRVKRNLMRETLLKCKLAHRKDNLGPIDIKFVFGRGDAEAQRIIREEHDLYNDTVVLDIAENMNSGKTWKFFSTAPQLFPNAAVVMKGDDDEIIRLSNYWKFLTDSSMPQSHLYWGVAMTFSAYEDVATFSYIGGMGVSLSRDLVDWISQSDIPRKYKDGHEDVQTGYWFAKAQIPVNVVHDTRFHDYLTGGNRRPITGESIVIHNVEPDEYMDVWQKTGC